MDFMSYLFGDRGGFDQVSRFTPQQQSLFNNFLPGLGQAQNSGLEYIRKLLSGEPGAFDEFEAPLMRQYNQEIVPGLAERFAGMGSGGAQNSSAFQQTLGQSGQELMERLGALRGNLRNNALGQLQGFTQQGLQPTFESVYRQPTQGLFGGLASGLSQGLGNYALMNAFKPSRINQGAGSQKTDGE